jgi:hypothetical protein
VYREVWVEARVVVVLVLAVRCAVELESMAGEGYFLGIGCLPSFGELRTCFCPGRGPKEKQWRLCSHYNFCFSRSKI